MNIKKLLFSRINSKIIYLFLFVVLVTSVVLIYFFYTIIKSSYPIVTLTNYELIKIIILIIILIIIDAVIISLYISHYISEPIAKIYNATKEIENGNYNINLDIKTGDEIELLSKTFNQTTLALKEITEERKELDNTKKEFLSMTSHELRSPMTPMKAQLQMLEEGYFGALTKKQKESIKIISRNVDSLDNLICDLLEISRIETAKLRFDFREIDIAKTVEDTVKFMDGFAKEKNIKLKINIDDLPIINADSDRLSQILRNLINNAIKFSNEKSNIMISAYKKDDYILFCVQDYGSGLKPEDQKRVFEPFYQVENVNHRRLGGTGLGLTICRGIVESQKGKIWVESKIGQGSKFYFTLPLNPVKDIEPIKLLFSQKETINKIVNEEFEKDLVGLGISEFNELKSKNKINIQKIIRNENKVENKKIKDLLQKNDKLDDKWSDHEFDSIFIFDENANILDCNDNMSKRLGYTKNEILLLNLTDIDILDSKQDIIKKINKIKKDGVISFKTMHKRKDGSAILVNEELQYNKNKNQFIGIICDDYLLEK